MTAKIKAALAAAAILASGAAITWAGLQAQFSAHGVLPDEWCSMAQRYSAPGEQSVFWLATRGGVTPPPTHAGRVIGECAAGVCRITSDSPVECSVTYTYQRAAEVGGWRLFKIRAPQYAGGSLKRWALDTAGVRWYGGFGGVVAGCTAHLSNAQCRSALSGVSDHWCHSANGRTCRGLAVCHGGLLYAAGVGGDQPCPLTAQWVPMPGRVFAGQDANVLAGETFTDEGLDL